MTTPPLMADISDPGTTVIEAPGLVAFAFYVGGNTPHVWDTGQVARQTLRYACPVWVYGLAGGHGGGLKEGAECKQALAAHGVPAGQEIAVRRDMEMAADVSWCDGFRAAIGPEYWCGTYGSAATVFANPPGGAGYWVADWVGHPYAYPHPHTWATQYDDSAQAGAPWDLSELNNLEHLWDRQPQAELDGHVTWWEGGTLHNRGVTSTDGGKAWR